MKTFTRLTALLIALICSFPVMANADDSEDFHSNLKEVLEYALKDNVACKVEGNDSGYYIFITHDYAFDIVSCVLMKFEPYETWANFVDSAVSAANIIQEILNGAEVKNPNLLFVILDDYGLDMPLLIICNGEVIYDCVSID